MIGRSTNGYRRLMAMNILLWAIETRDNIAQPTSIAHQDPWTHCANIHQCFMDMYSDLRFGQKASLLKPTLRES